MSEKKDEKKEATKAQIFWVVAVAFAVLAFTPVWLAIATFVVTILVGFATKFVRLVVVHEATAVNFKFMGQFAKTVIQLKDHGFNATGNIVFGFNQKSWGSCPLVLRVGGWVFYVKGLVEPAKYGDNNDDDGLGKDEHINLNDTSVEIVLKAAELKRTKAGGTVPPDVKFTVVLRVRNPQKWQFVSPRNAKDEATKGRVQPFLKSWVRASDDEHVQGIKSDGESLWRELHEPAVNAGPTITWLYNDWGLDVAENAILVTDIGYPDDYQEALRAGETERLKVEADVEATAKKAVRIAAAQAGLKVEKLERMLRKDPTLRAKPAIEGGFREAFRVCRGHGPA